MDIAEIDVSELERRMAAGAPVFDVREPGEYETVRIPDSTLVPLNEVPDEIERFRSNATVYVVCARGGRSAQAVQFLQVQGIDAVNVAGGMMAWIDAGFVTESGPLGGG